jgi:hypothetical protein
MPAIFWESVCGASTAFAAVPAARIDTAIETSNLLEALSGTEKPHLEKD